MSTASTPPSVSVITICKNAAATITRTLESVAQCKYPRLQYVVVDGGSTDDTHGQIQRYRGRIDKFISETDRGISDALNKAVELSDGDYHLIVHADDTLSPGALSKLLAHGYSADAKVVCGSVNVMGNAGVFRRFIPQPKKLTYKMSVPHMGALVSRDAWAAVGGYDLRRKIAMDHLLFLRILKQFGLNAFVTVDTVVADYYLGGVSDRMELAGFREVRDNLIEEGYGALRANAAYLQLRLKSRIARLVVNR